MKGYGIPGEYDATELKDYTSVAQHMDVLTGNMTRILQEKNPDVAVHEFLKEAGMIMNADRTYIFEKSGTGSFESTYEWKREGMKEALLTALDLPSGDEASEIRDALHANECYMISDLNEYSKADPGFANALKLRNIDRLLVLPIFIEGEYKGFAGMSNPDRVYLCGGKSLLRMIANCLAMLLRHRDSRVFIDNVSRIDSLTGLYSMNLFVQVLRNLIDEIRNGAFERHVSVVTVDIHNFKLINRTNGFAYGDTMLRKLGEMMAMVIGENKVARYYADHFYTIIEDSEAEEKIRRIHSLMLTSRIEIRAGIYPLDPNDKELSASQAVDRARIACDAAMDDYNDYYRRYDPQMEYELVQKDYLTNNIDRAISLDWIKVYYQPIINSFSEKVSCVEALARWNDTVYGFLNPAAFIQTLEEAHLLYKLDLHILELACRDIRKKKDDGEPYCPASVNISRNDLEVPDLHERINSILNVHGVPHDLIRIEITETALLNNEEVIRDHIDRFHRDGYEVWLDDFGSGYSSLNTLQHFDFDCIKIDMEFLRRANEKTPAVLRNIIDMTKHLKVLSLIEGVETQQQYDFMKDIGCVLVQGYFFSKPVPVDQLADILAGRSISLETTDERDFYGSIGRINVLDTIQPLEEEEPFETPGNALAIVQIEKGRQKTLYANSACRFYLKKRGLEHVADADERDNDTSLPYRKLIRGCMRKCAKAGRPVRMEFNQDGYAGSMEVRLIAESEKRKAYLITCANIRPANLERRKNRRRQAG